MDAIDHQVLPARPTEARTAFWPEFQDYWTHVPNKWLFLTMLAGWMVLFQFVGISSFSFGAENPSLFGWLYDAWNTPNLDSGQGNLIPFAVLVLFWVRRRELAATVGGIWWPALAVVGLALLLHVAGFLAQQPRISVIGLFLGLYGLIGVVWGRRTMWASTFPMVLFAFCMPMGTFAEAVTLPLRMVSVTLTRLVSHGVLDIDVIQVGTNLRDAKGNYEFDVVAACSGIRSFMASLALATVIAMLVLRPLWKRAVLLAATVPLVIFGNVLRLTVVVLVGQAYGQASGEWVHDWFGYVTYLMVNIVALLALAHWLREKPSSTGV